MQRDKSYTFEDPKNPASEWLDCCERAKEIAQANNYAGDEYNASTLSSPSSTIGGLESNNGHHHHPYSHDIDRDSVHGEKNGDRNSEKNKRFSKRSSRGFAAVF